MLVPLVVGDCSALQVAEVLEMLWGGNETLIVVSSDLSHFQSEASARVQDKKTADAILALSPGDIHADDACGRNPIRGLLLAARLHQLNPLLLDLRTSADTAGSPERVVGYGAFVFSR